MGIRVIVTNYFSKDGEEYPAYPDGSSIIVYDDFGYTVFNREFTQTFGNKDEVLTELVDEYYFNTVYEDQSCITIDNNIWRLTY